ncbi:MAG: hypothetical protein GY765_10485, partial [bacterium]|nr:hypothetical protein [bacterium]
MTTGINGTGFVVAQLKSINKAVREDGFVKQEFRILSAHNVWVWDDWEWQNVLTEFPLDVLKEATHLFDHAPLQKDHLPYIDSNVGSVLQPVFNEETEIPGIDALFRVSVVSDEK